MFLLPKSVDLNKIWDVVIIGAGPAGLAAALYAARAKLSTLVIEKLPSPGGWIAKTWIIEDYPGFPTNKGEELTNIMEKQAKEQGAQFLYNTEVVDVTFGKPHTIKLYNNKEIKAKIIILAMGSNPKMLNVPGEKEYIGRGVSFCAVCDAPFFKDKVVAVVGGGNSAVEESLYIAKFARKVYLIHRRDKLRADKVLQYKLFKTKNIEVLWNTEVKEIIGDGKKLTKIKIYNNKEENESFLEVDGLFIFIGTIPSTSFLRGKVEMNEWGYIKTNEYMETSQKRVFAVGDIRENVLKQAITAAAEGAIAGWYAEKVIEYE